MLIRASGITDVGLKREANEDCFTTDDTLGLYVVADGMGGHLAGEVASSVAVELIKKSFAKWTESDASEEAVFGLPDQALSRRGNYVLGSIRLANRVIHEMALHYDKYHGMGTTVAILAVFQGLVISANVGDSRIYMLRNGHLERLSKDHTIVAEQVEMGIMDPKDAETSPLKHVLTKNLGSSETVNAEIFEFEPASGDRFLLCSDGLTDLMADEEILQMIQEEDSPDILCRNFVDEALKRGGHDNTTVISILLSGIEASSYGPLKRLGIFLADSLTGVHKISRKLKP
ncbi:MAG: PP2C family serine/threonine-protein phosphatase [Desulfatiglandaceae bacterium]